MDNVLAFYSISIITAGITIALAVIGAASAQGKAAASAFEAMARQPEAQGGINSSLILSLALIESLAIYALAVSLIILFANPFLSYVTVLP
ncbi:MAG TPA: ATP synthase F0 subunit C [Caldisericia bacterium]|jgi:F-type H+-transporting ATPase subunit c|nr:ATP synthase F0 subunit C [Caldisericia bacterium]HXK51588.1 ATP synthase F0 subunit C [Caldisericia bacterium]